MGPIIRLLSVSFPAFNEEPNIGPLLDESLEVLRLIAESFEIIVVDDGSIDGTAEVVRTYAEKHAEVRLVVHPQNLGYGHALRTGLQHARGDAIRADRRRPPVRIADLGSLVELLHHNDVVLGCRIKRADPWHRLVVARVYHHVLTSVFGLHLRDVDCAMKLYKREVVDAILPDLESRSAFISPELAIRAQHAGFTRIAEVGVTHRPRVAGRSKGATPKVIARTISEIVRLRRSLGQRDPAAGRPRG